MDVMQGMSGSAIWAARKQNIGCFVTFCSYWVIGISCSYFLAFNKNMDAKGLWVGPSMACTVQFSCFVLIEHFFIDWRAVIKMSSKLRKEDEQATSRKELAEKDS